MVTHELLLRRPGRCSHRTGSMPTKRCAKRWVRRHSPGAVTVMERGLRGGTRRAGGGPTARLTVADAVAEARGAGSEEALFAGAMRSTSDDCS